MEDLDGVCRNRTMSQLGIYSATSCAVGARCTANKGLLRLRHEEAKDVTPALREEGENRTEDPF